MQFRTVVGSIVLSSTFLFACGGSAPAAKTEADPWSDYKGTYASSSGSRGESSASKPDAKEAKAKAADAPKEEAAAPAAPDQQQPAPALAAKKASKTTIHGESISAIAPATLADVSKAALKSKVVRTKMLVGADYEQVQIQLKGVAVQIVRPAANPVTGGPSVASPKARNASLSKTESAWYDEDADVLIVVNAPKKATSQKALGAILER